MTPIPTRPDIYDAAKAVIKSRVKRFPSAYASGMLVQLYKRVMKAVGEPAYIETSSRRDTKPALTRWFDEKWVDVSSGKPCGSVRSGKYYPTCRPLKTFRKMTNAEKKHMIARKQRAKSKTAVYI